MIKKTPVSVYLEIDDESIAQGPLISRVEAELELLFEDLALPLTAKAASRDGSKTSYYQSEIRLFLENTPIRLPYVNRSPVDAENHLLTGIHAGRETFITPAVVTTAWENWGGQGSPPAEFATSLRQLAKYRLRIDRAADAEARWQADNWDLAFEAALSNASRRIRILVPSGVKSRLEAQRQPETIGQSQQEDRFDMMIDGLFYELGVHVGSCILEESAALRSGEMRIAINDLRTMPYKLMPPETILVNDTVERLRLLGIQGQPAINPANGNLCAFISAGEEAAALEAGLTVWGELGYIILAASYEIRANAFTLLSRDMLTFTLNKLESSYSDILAMMRERVGEPDLVKILRLLVEEEISIRDMRQIIETLLLLPEKPYTGLDQFILFGSNLRPEVAQEEAPPATGILEAVEAIRSAFKNYISHKYTRGQNKLIVYLLDPEIERLVQHAPVLSETDREAVLRAIEIEVGSLPPTAQTPVVLTTATIRSKFRRLIRPEFPLLNVLSYQELAPTMNIQPIARISLD